MATPTAIAGRGGSVRINGTPVSTVALVKEWTATISPGFYDSTSLGDDWKQVVAGFRTMTGKISGSWDVTSDAGQTALHNAAMNATSVGLNLIVDGANGYELTAFLNEFTTTDPVDGLVTFECSFTNTGQVYFI